MNPNAYLLMFSVPQHVKVNRQDVIDAAQKYKLDLSLVPTQKNEPDAFTKACRDAIGLPKWRNLLDAQGREVKLSWTKVKNDQRAVQLNLMQQIMGGSVDGLNHIGNPVEHAVLKVFYRKEVSGSINNKVGIYTPVDENGDDNEDKIWAEGIDYAELMVDLDKRFKALLHGTCDFDDVNRSIKRYAKRLNGRTYRKMRSVYYIPEVTECLKLVRAVREFSEGQVDISAVPMYDDPAMMRELKEYFESDLTEDMKELFMEIDPKGQMQDRKLERIERDIQYFEQVATAYDGIMSRKKIEVGLTMLRGQLDLAKTSNVAWKASKEADKIRKKDEQRKLLRQGLIS